MVYTVKKVSKLSKVSVRTLHFYDEIGLLRPAYYGANGYRYYGEQELLHLQQILFFRELGFSLKKIKTILDRDDFNQLVALTTHRKALEKTLERTQKLIVTIDKTIKQLKGKRTMKETEIYDGFNEEKQAAYEKELLKLFGKKVEKHLIESKEKTKHWTKKDWEKSHKAYDSICKELSQMIEKGDSPSSPEVQQVVQKHLHFLQSFWTPNKESYIGHSELIIQSELRKTYDSYHPELAVFLSKAIRIFATENLK